MAESVDPRPVSKVGRRTLIAGAAWAVPTVAVLSATPAFAASAAKFSDYFVMVDDPAKATLNGHTIAVYYASLRNITTSTLTVSATASATPSTGGGWVPQVDNPSGGTFTLAPGSLQQLGFQAHTFNWSDAPAGTYTITLTLTITKVGTPGSTVVTRSWTN